MSTQAKDRASTPRPIGKAATLPLVSLVPSPSNRRARRDEDLKGLASSIRAVGLIHPLIVQLDDQADDVYRIIAGERRWRAMKMLKLESAPCIVLSAKADGANAEVLRVAENHQRLDLAPLEEAAAVRGLLDIGLEPEAVARSLGRSRAWVARRASLTELSDRWREAAQNVEFTISSWPPSHLEVISRFPAEVQDRILDRWGSAWQWKVPSFRDLVEQTGQFLHLLSAAPWKIDDETLIPETGACSACPKRSSRAPDLFAGELEGDGGTTTPGDRCLDPECWACKAERFLKSKAEALRKEHPKLVLLDNGQDGDDLDGEYEGEVLHSEEVTTSRKTDRKAVPALVVNGPGLGRIRWVRPVQSARLSGSSRHDSHEMNGSDSAPSTPEDKRRPYDKRRRQLVIEAVKAKLLALAAEDDLAKAADLEGAKALKGKGLTVKTLVLLSALLSERGWRSQVNDGALSLPDGLPWETLNALKNHELGTGETRAAALQLCWSLLRHALTHLAARLSLAPGERDNAAHCAEAETLCAMLGFDLTAFRADAARAVPYAKLWRAQIADEWATPSA